MKKILIILPILLLAGFILFDYMYYPLISSKAEQAAEQYLEETYNEDFIIDDSSYSKQLGEDFGKYHISAHPTNDPSIAVKIIMKDNMKISIEDYLQMKWRSELNEQFTPLYEELYGPSEHYSYMVNVSFPDDIDTKYSSTNTYQEILEQQHTAIGNMLFANVFLSSTTTMDEQLEKAFTLIQHLQKQDLQYFSVYIEYYNESLKQELSKEEQALDYHAFSNKFAGIRTKVFSIDTRNEEDKRNLENLKTSADLKQYLQ